MKNLFFGSVALLALAAAGPAVAADMPVKVPVYKAPPAIVAYNWSGFYVGANVGYSWGRSSNDWNFNAPAGNLGGFNTVNQCPGTAFCASGSDANKLNGAIGGLQAGYNWQTGNFLAGVEADFQVSSQKGDQLFSTGYSFGSPGFFTATGTLSADYTEKLPWLGTLRGRAGFTADRVLFYATGGLAYGRVNVDGSANSSTSIGQQICTPCSIPLASFSNSVTKVGWTVGAGVEGAISDRWSVKVEYLYVDLGTVNTAFSTSAAIITPCGGACTIFNAGSGSISSRITDNIVRVGLNYRFGDYGKGPLVARY